MTFHYLDLSLDLLDHTPFTGLVICVGHGDFHTWLLIWDGIF